MQNPELQLAFDFVQSTNRNIFLTGKAGTGKTTFLHSLKASSPKRMVVVAPTGVAAINAGGVTAHSFFQLPFGPILPERLNAGESSNDRNSSYLRFNKRKINIIRSLDLLIIDEISMVRADMLDGIDQILRRYKNRNKVFGGAQVLMIGDLQQLAPVVKEDEWLLLRQYYDTAYFFSSKAFRESQAVTIELKHVYRQQDDFFINILNEIRDDCLSPASYEALNKRFIPGFRPENEEGYITLTTHNAIANRINRDQLDKVKSQEFIFEAEVKGQFPEYAYPAEQYLKLKESAQVMFIKNDSSPEKRYFNGKIGRITGIDEETIYVQCENEEWPIEVGQEQWENVRYSINDISKEIEENVAGTFIQYPLRLAWAITIHKSQGLTFEKAVIDARSAFAHGQTYVALSRCKSIEGLVLSTRISAEGIICDPTIGRFNADVGEHQPNEKTLQHSRQNFQLELLDELFSYRQLLYYIEKCKKLTYENSQSIQGDLPEKLDEILRKGTRPLNEVAEKFISQLKAFTFKNTSEETIRERIQKGAVYFSEQSRQNIEIPIEEAGFETDNASVRKSIDETLLKIRELIHIKKACFEHCKKGFVLKDYLRVRAVAELEPALKPKVRPDTSKKMSDHPKLYERLREWRNKVATDEGIKHFQVISQRALLGISNSLPGNQHSLLEIKGIGKKKFEQFGEAILQLVNDYCEEQKLKPVIANAKIKPEKKNTKRISLELFREGKSINQIAHERNFAVSTIEGHLAYFIGTGELNIDQFVEPKILEIITEFFLDHPEVGLNEAKEALDSSITYGTLKMVQRHQEYLQKKNEL